MKKVILDCDPGIDDAFAIMLAARHLDLLGVTAIGGNSNLENVTMNALKILEVIGRTDIPVYPGCSTPMVTPLVTAPHAHGENGLGGLVLPAPARKPEEMHAVDFIVDTVMSTDDVTLIATGPLTNIAEAINREPKIVDRAKEIYIMGGSVTFGNWTPTAEFNIYVDPEAAYRVFNSGLHVKMVGLNLTRQCMVTNDWIEEIRNLNTKAARFGADLLGFYMNAAKRHMNISAANIHDACTVAWLIDPSLIKGADMHITVELKGDFTRGMTVCDYRHLRSGEKEIDLCHSDIPTMSYRGEKPNAEAALELDFQGFMKLLLETLESFN